jgi:hypothetical protein
MYVRVKILDRTSLYYDKIGEIIDININNIDTYLVQLSNNDVAGFNNSIEFQKIMFHINQFELLDHGLNSPYTVDIDKVLYALKK